MVWTPRARLPPPRPASSGRDVSPCPLGALKLSIAGSGCFDYKEHWRHFLLSFFSLGSLSLLNVCVYTFHQISRIFHMTSLVFGDTHSLLGVVSELTDFLKSLFSPITRWLRSSSGMAAGKKHCFPSMSGSHRVKSHFSDGVPWVFSSRACVSQAIKFWLFHF